MKKLGIEGIYIDDTGNPGVKAPSVFLPESRKSWAAIIIPQEIANEIETAMTIFLGGVKKDYGVNELHFTDIYSGRGVWKDVAVAERIEIFDLMTMLISKFNIPILYQTFSEEFKNDHKEFWDSVGEVKFPFWNFNKIEHIGYFLLLIKTKEVLRDLRSQDACFNHIFQIYTDEGMAKHGSQQVVPVREQQYFKKSIIFQSSESCIGLQISDFVAFVMSKSQRILMEKKSGELLSPPGRQIMSITPKLNLWTGDLIKVDEKQFSKEGYEFILKKDRKNKKLPISPQKK